MVSQKKINLATQPGLSQMMAEGGGGGGTEPTKSPRLSLVQGQLQRNGLQSLCVTTDVSTFRQSLAGSGRR